MDRRRLCDVLIPVLILASATAFLSIADADMRIERLFFQPGRGWVYANDSPWHSLYKYGMLPGLVMGALAAAVFLAGFVSKQAARYRKEALFFVLLLALGPGLVTSVLKDCWGRPRPRQVDSLGGDMKYQQVWQTGTPGKGKSFPSGHAAIAFYLIAPFFVLRRSHAVWAFFCLLLGLGYGVLMGTARMAQGGHFPSDVLWSAGFVYLTALSLSYALFRDQCNDGKTDGRGVQRP